MRKFIAFLIIISCHSLLATAQISTLNKLLSEYTASYNDDGFTSLSASLSGQYLTIRGKMKRSATLFSIRLDMKSTKMSVTEDRYYGFRFNFKDDNGLDYTENLKKYMKDDWSFTCDSQALKNKTEDALRNIYASFVLSSLPSQSSSIQSANSQNSTSVDSNPSKTATSDNSKPSSINVASEKKTYSCKYFSIRFPQTWKTVVVGDPNSSTASLTDASVTIRISNPAAGEPARNVAINMDSYVDWKQIDQSSLSLLKTPIKRQYPNAVFIKEPEFVQLAGCSGVKMVYTTNLGSFTAMYIGYIIHKSNGFTYYITACIDNTKATAQEKEVSEIIKSLTVK